MITSKDCCRDLERTCRMITQLVPFPLEVLIKDHGCRDDTVAMVRRQSPGLRLLVNTVGKGSVASRDCMMRETRTDLILALDDYSYPEQADAVGRVQELFATRPAFAVAAFPQGTDEYPETVTRTACGAPRRAPSRHVWSTVACCGRKSTTCLHRFLRLDDGSCACRR